MPNRVGSWWGAHDVEIDAVALDLENGRALFGECKFWTKPAGINVFTHLKEQATKALQDPTFGPYRDNPVFAIFSIGGFTKELQTLASEREDVFLFE